MSHISAWLRNSSNSNSSSSSVNTPSHVFLNGGNGGNGGKVHLSDAEPTRTAFLEAYAKDVLKGTLLYVVERTDVSYRMFADFDIMLETTRLPTTHLPTLIEHALSSFPVHNKDDVISICTREANGGKVGAHMIWRDLRVDDAGAKSIRDAWVAELDDEAWDDTIDASVYKRNGLRMPWSRKRDDAIGAGVYKPTYTWNLHTGLVPWEGNLQSHAAVLEALKRCSILATTAPPPPIPITMSLPAERERMPDRHSRPTSTSSSTMLSSLSSSSTTRSAIRSALVHMGLDEWTQTRIHAESPGRCILFTCLPSSRTCRIAGREHRSNHIYHQIVWDFSRNEWNLRQRCHSAECCDRYCSLGYILPQGHAHSDSNTTRAASSTHRAIATMADRWMAKLG